VTQQQHHADEVEDSHEHASDAQKLRRKRTETFGVVKNVAASRQ